MPGGFQGSAPKSHANTGARPRRSPPALETGVLHWARTYLFNNVHNSILTILVLWALALNVPDLIRWAFVDAVWVADDAAVCKGIAGACWAVIAEKHRVILFGTFPYEEHWRGVAVIAIVILLSIASAFRRLWSYWLFAVWVLATVVVLILMFGGVFGLKPVTTNKWGGLPLTFLLFIGTVVGGLPAAVMLALGRRSQMPVIRAMSVGFIEITRGTPLIVVLFMASLMFPLFIPERLTIDKLLRAQIGMIFFFGAYAAEVVRGGLQAIPRGQYEAADACGLTYWQKTRRIILPQALRIVIPPIMNDIIRAFKNTTFVSILGLYDILGATKAALEDMRWVKYSPEAYIFIFALYFMFCFSMSKYSQSVENTLSKGKNF